MLLKNLLIQKTSQLKMVLCFLLIHISTSKLPPLEMQSIGAPKFQELEDDDEIFDIEERFDRDTKISGISKNARVNEYFLCSVEISESSTFSDNFAFGVGIAAGSGGSIFLTFSSLIADSPIFEKNYATIGGACALLSSQAYLKNPKIQSNIALRYGGGVYFQGVWALGEEIQNRQVLYQIGGIYEENDATEVGGGICFTTAGCSFLEDVIFKTNTAGISGGGLYSASAPLKLFTCSFMNNYAGTWDGVVAIRQTAENPIVSNPRFRARGGGGICFLSKRLKQLYTANCFFGGNNAKYPASFGNGPGHEMLLDGACHWISYRDTISGFKENVSVTYTTQQWKHGKEAKYELFYLNADDNTNNWPEYTANYTFTEMPIKYQTIQREINENPITYVPSPSPFIYVATQITALPYATTSFHHPTLSFIQNALSNSL